MDRLVPLDQLTLNQRVQGSSPCAPTKIRQRLESIALTHESSFCSAPVINQCCKQCEHGEKWWYRPFHSVERAGRGLFASTEKVPPKQLWVCSAGAGSGRRKLPPEQFTGRRKAAFLFCAE